ncbi:MAG: SDR family NAD(P)-dependent oxidoreductase [Alphaproteobacteria bacterium]|nr:SDR family NAD(P)-dependent oxidoreductase [Alphaproteobacteria bacterium]
MSSPVTFDLSHDVALVTGASSGLGARFASVLAQAGAKVVIAGRRAERLADVARDIAANGGKAYALTLDVTKTGTLGDAVDQAEKLAGKLTVLVNNAGMNVLSSASALKSADYDKIMDTNVKAAFFMTQTVGSRMVERKVRGRIVNIASIGAFKALPGLVAYSMSKAAIAMMTKGFAREWARHNIAVNALCPGYIKTELNDEWFDSEGGQKQIAGFPRRRLSDAASLDALLLTLCSARAEYLTGSLFTVDDGQLL